MPALEPSGANRPARSVVGPSASAMRPPGPWTASANCSPEMRTAGAKVRPPSVERERKEWAPLPIVRGTITSTTPGAGSSTETRERL